MERVRSGSEGGRGVRRAGDGAKLSGQISISNSGVCPQ